MEGVDELLDRAHFLEFAGAVKLGAAFLPWQERWKIERKAKILVGRLVWRLIEIVPAEHYSDVDEASLVKATADTRTSTEQPLCGPALAEVRPIDPRWDAALKAVEKLQRTYPG